MNRFFFFLGRACVLGVLAVGPWAAGGSEPAFLRGTAIAIVVATLGALGALWTTPRRERRQNAYSMSIFASIFLASGLALSSWQLLPLSDATLERVAPRVAELKRAALPPTAPELSLADLSKPDFQVSSDFVSDETFEETTRLLNEAFPADEVAPLNVRDALAVDAAIENELLPQDSAARNAWGRTISVYPLASFEAAAPLWAAALLCLATSILFNETRARRFLWRTIVVNGLAFALFCVATRANPALFQTEAYTRLFGEEFNRWNYGTYVNKNAAGGYLVLILGVALSFFALEFLKTVDALKEEKIDPRAAELEKLADSVYSAFRPPLWRRFSAACVEFTNRKLVFSFFVVGFLIAAIFASLSRGASLASCVALIGAFSALAVRKSSRRFWPALAIPIVVAALGLTWTRLSEPVQERMSTLVVEEEEGEGTAVDRDARWENWRAALELGREDYFWFGSGLGTYALAIRGADVNMKEGRLFYHAENLFVETFLETGIVGLTILVLFFGGAFVVLFARLGGRRGFETTAGAIGFLASTLGLIASASGDFGIYLPANLFLFAATFGAFCGGQKTRFWKKIAADLKNAKTAVQAAKRAERAARRTAIGATALSVFIVGGLSLAPSVLGELNDYVERTRLLREASETTENAIYSSVADVDATAARLRAYVERRDDSFELRRALAELNEALFRLKYWEERAARGESAVDANAWALASFDYYAELVLNYRRIDFHTAAGSIAKNPTVAETAPRAVSDLLAARRICPLFERAHERLALLSPLAIESTFQREREEIELCARRAAALSPFNSGTLCQTARTLRAARIEPLWKLFYRRAFEYSDRVAEPILTFFAINEKSPKIEEYVEQIVPDETRAIRTAINRFASQKKSRVFAAVAQKGVRVFDAVPEGERDADYYCERALFRQKIGLAKGADEDFQRAVELNPDEPIYRYYRGVFLCSDGKFLNLEEEALRLLQEFDRSRDSYRMKARAYWLKVAAQNWKKRQARDAVDARLGARPEKEGDAEPLREEPPVVEPPKKSDKSKELTDSIKRQMKDLGVAL